MSEKVSGLEPRPVFEHFGELLRIPRPSGHEARVAAHLEEVARRHGFQPHRDGVGNLVIDVPASEGRGTAPTVILQGHLDMVAEKNKDTAHDFLTDPIRPRIEGEWLHATGTTLGADNGIGVAAAMAAATDPSCVHGPLQLLFTVDEETGLTGAMKLDARLLRGTILLNLDSEEDGVLFVGCAGGADTVLRFLPAWTRPAGGASSFLMEIGGLRGGHSGLNIHENRGNALKLATRILAEAVLADVPYALASIGGGSKHNAIPREAEVRLWIEAAAESRFRAVMDRMLVAFRTELEGIDDGLFVRLGPAPDEGRVMTAEDRNRFLHLLLALPHGVLGMSPSIPGLVETSSNLAVVQSEGDRLKIVTSSRSSIEATKAHVLLSIRAAARLADAEVEARDGYPGWKPNMASRALKVVREVYATLWKREPKVTAIHAGLECGLLGDKVPGLDMVSFGPHMEGVHSPDERLHIPSVGRFYDALKMTLDRLSRP